MPFNIVAFLIGIVCGMLIELMMVIFMNGLGGD